MKKLLLILLLIVIIAGAYAVWEFNKTVIVVSNIRSEDLRDVKITTRNNSIDVGTIGWGSSPLPSSNSKRIVLPNKIGESSIEMSYNDGKVWQGGYIENRDKIRIIYSDAGISAENIPLFRFLLRM